MPAWSLSGSILLALTAAAGGDRAGPSAKAETKLRVIDAVSRDSYRMPDGRQDALLTTAEYHAPIRDRRLDRTLSSVRSPISDPQGDCVRRLLRDRMARRGNPLDARVEWRLTGDRSDVGLGGGLKRVVDTLLHD